MRLLCAPSPHRKHVLHSLAGSVLQDLIAAVGTPLLPCPALPCPALLSPTLCWAVLCFALLYRTVMLSHPAASRSAVMLLSAALLSPFLCYAVRVVSCRAVLCCSLPFSSALCHRALPHFSDVPADVTLRIACDPCDPFSSTLRCLPSLSLLCNPVSVSISTFQTLD